MNKNDYKILEEAYGNILLKEFDNGETETPEEMEHEKIGMLKNHLRSVMLQNFLIKLKTAKWLMFLLGRKKKLQLLLTH